MNVRSRLSLLFVMATLSACAQVGSGNGNTGSGGSFVPGSGGHVGSGSGSGGLFGASGGAGGLITGGGMGGDTDCGLQSFDLVRKPADVMLVLDRSASMQNDSADVAPTSANDPTKWAQVVPAMTGVVTATGGGSDISWGLKTFPEDGSACSNNPSTVTTKIDVGVKTMNATAMNLAIMTTTPNGNGTPTSAAVRVATSYLQGLNDGNRKYILLATDGDPSCGGVSGALTSNTTAVADAVSALSASLAAGVPAFVVGVGSKASSLMTLNMLAVAGGEPVQDPNPLAMRFYQAANQAQLNDALAAITSQVNTCTFPLSKVPPVPDNIAVKVTGVKAPFDSTNTEGWNYTDASQTAVQVYGSWCTMIKTSAANMVQIIFGCPNITIP